MGAVQAGCAIEGSRCSSLPSASCRECASDSRAPVNEWSPTDEADRTEDYIATASAFRSAVGATGAQPKAAADPKNVACRMRIIQITDVYVLDNMPGLKALVNKESEGFPPENIVRVLPGDFLAPSLLSSLDAGYSMVKVLNHIPIDMLCFGNHDGNDIAPSKLVHRIGEFKGHWLNSNMPDFVPKLPEYAVRDLTGEDGSKSARRVAFLGFCIGGGKWQAMYREEAFCGAHRTIVPVLEAVPGAIETVRREQPDVADIIPLTHQDLAEDIEMACSGLFPVICGGHDHEQILETHGARGCPIVKPGMDAFHAAIIDLEWDSLEADAQPRVNVVFKAVADYAPDKALADLCEKAQRPIRELETATLYELKHGEVLSSVNARHNDVSMARALATWVRQCLRCDAVVINSGTVRGNKEYSDTISYGDLKKECPFNSAMIVVSMPFRVLRAGVLLSRTPWKEAEEGTRAKKECASALQVDEGISIADHAPATVMSRPPESDEELFSVACDVYVLRKNNVFREYCEAFPDRVPPSDAGRPLLPILVEFFCAGMWRQLIDGASYQVMSTSSLENFQRSAKPADENMELTDSEAYHLDKGASKIFQLLDENGDGKIDIKELQNKVCHLLGDRLSSKIVIEQLMQMADDDADGMLSQDELLMAIRKVVPQAMK